MFIFEKGAKGAKRCTTFTKVQKGANYLKSFAILSTAFFAVFCLINPSLA